MQQMVYIHGDTIHTESILLRTRLYDKVRLMQRNIVWIRFCGSWDVEEFTRRSKGALAYNKMRGSVVDDRRKVECYIPGRLIRRDKPMTFSPASPVTTVYTIRISFSKWKKCIVKEESLTEPIPIIYVCTCVKKITLSLMKLRKL